MKAVRLQLFKVFLNILSAGFHASLSCARITERTLFLSTYSDDLECSNIVYARIDNDICTDTSVCAIHNDTDGSFHDTEMTACIVDREAFLTSAFKGAPYLTIELYPTDCLGKSYNTRSFLADGNCHPYALSHFKVMQANGTTSVLSAESGCEATDWYKEWSVNSLEQLNTEACVTDGTKTWKAYFVEGATAADGSTDTPAATVAAPTSSIASPTPTSTTPTANSSNLTSSQSSTPISAASTVVLILGVAISGKIALLAIGE